MQTVTVTLANGRTVTSESTHSPAISGNYRLWDRVSEASGLPGVGGSVCLPHHWTYDEAQPEHVFVRRATVTVRRAIVRENGVADYTIGETMSAIVVVREDYRN